MSRVMNFNSGPATLPLEALERAREELLDFEGTGMSVMEHSHRGKTYERVHDEAMALIRELLALPASHDVLFVQGGASQAFAQVPMNFLEPGKTVDYVVMGVWGEKAVAEARAMAAILGCGEVRRTGAEPGPAYTRAPTQGELSLTRGAAYVHVTSNETVHGIQYALDASTPFPTTESPLVCDMSSDILGRRLDVSKFDLVYAGAQKNLGPSGLTVVVASKDMLARGRRDLPAIFQYRTHAEQRSLYNTPPTFGVYLARNTLAWLKAQGGVEAMEVRNRRKAATLYEAIDASGGFYRCPVAAPSRSIMNVVWRLPTPELDAAFVKEAEAQGMVGLKGHRVVGGLRASIYNAAPPAWTDALASFMKDFAKRFG